MKLSRKDLQGLRLLANHLREMITDAKPPKCREDVVATQVAWKHLLWVERTLLEEHPDPDELAANMCKCESAMGALVRVTKDIVGGG